MLSLPIGWMGSQIWLSGLYLLRGKIHAESMQIVQQIVFLLQIKEQQPLYRNKDMESDATGWKIATFILGMHKIL